MKHQNLLVLLITIFSVITISCSNDEEDEDLMGKWYRVSDFDGLARGEATSFTIGNKGYLTGGYDGRKHLNGTAGTSGFRFSNGPSNIS